MIAREIASIADKYIGNSKYTWGGGRNPLDIAAGRFDCSSFTNYVFKQTFGVDIGSTTREQRKIGRRLSTVENPQPGDLVFFDTNQKDGHVGIYMGNGKVLGAQTSTGVAVFDMSKGYWKDKFKGHVRRVVE